MPKLVIQSPQQSDVVTTQTVLIKDVACDDNNLTAAELIEDTSEKSKEEEKSLVVSDKMSTTSFMDKISSIFSFGGAV